MWESSVRECQKQTMTDRDCMACKEVFCWCCVSGPQPTDIFGGRKWCIILLHLTNTYVYENFGGAIADCPALVAGLLCIPSANSAKIKLPAIIEHNNVLDHKRNENVVGGVESWIFQWLLNLSLLKLRKKLSLQHLYDGTAQQQLLSIHVKQSKGIEKITIYC